MLFLMGLVAAASLMVLARRRAGSIRLRVERRSQDARPASWPRRDQTLRAHAAGLHGAICPEAGDAVAGTAATVGVTFPEDLCIQVGVR